MLDNRHQSPQELAYHYLRDGIVSGQLRIGTRIKAEVIAEALGISRMPVREALRQLDSEGLVTLRRNRGAVVTVLKPDEIIEIFQMRAVLEGLAAYHAALKVTAADFVDLDYRLNRMMLAKQDYALWLEEHDLFHERFCAVSGMPRLSAQLTTIRQQIRPYLQIYAEEHTDPEIAGHDHNLLIERLRTGDPHTAEQAMRDHIIINGESTVSSLRELLTKIDSDEETGNFSEGRRRAREAV